MGIISAIAASFEVIGDAIESIGTGEYRQDILAQLRKAAVRGAELAVENARLKDEVERLKYWPSLSYEEVDALRFAMNGCDSDTRCTLRRIIDRYKDAADALDRQEHPEFYENEETSDDGADDICPF